MVLTGRCSSKQQAAAARIGASSWGLLYSGQTHMLNNNAWTLKSNERSSWFGLPGKEYLKVKVQGEVSKLNGERKARRPYYYCYDCPSTIMIVCLSVLSPEMQVVCRRRLSLSLLVSHLEEVMELALSLLSSMSSSDGSNPP